MPGASLKVRNPEGGNGSFGKVPFVAGRAFRIAVSPFAKTLSVAAGWIRARRFRQDVMRQMRLTITNLHPQVTIGGTDRRGWYTEVYLSFAEFRLRITRARYGPHHQGLWADIGPVFEPSTFFRLDYVMTALRRMEEPWSCADASESPTTLAKMDVTIWAAHARLAEHLSGVRYGEIRSTIQQVMREGSAMARPE